METSPNRFKVYNKHINIGCCKTRSEVDDAENYLSATTYDAKLTVIAEKRQGIGKVKLLLKY